MTEPRTDPVLLDCANETIELAAPMQSDNAQSRANSLKRILSPGEVGRASCEVSARMTAARYEQTRPGTLIPGIRFEGAETPTARRQCLSTRGTRIERTR